MDDPSSEKPDQPAAAEGAKPEDAAARLNEILSSPIADPFAPEAKPPVPPDLAARGGAKLPPTEGVPAAGWAPSIDAASTPAAGPAPAPQGAPSDPGEARVIARVRHLMLISTLLTALAIVAVFSVIGYRVFRGEGRFEAPTQATLTLPQGARIVQTALAEDRIVLTLEIGGALEIRTYDLKTLEPLGRLTFTSVP